MHKRLSRPALVLMLMLGSVVGLGAAAPSAGAQSAYVCGTQSGGSTTVHSHITDVRVGRHASFDRFVVVFSTLRLPHYTITPKSNSTFTRDPSGAPVHLLGNAGLKLVMHSVTGRGTYFGPADYRTGFPQLREARLLGDFEGYVTWGLGLAHQSCKRVFKLTSPTRLVIDVPH
ncbi:MAG TPA: hypothetical protein VHS54_05155 [Jatrophihabitans sp.]|jgi:hypothetical protein|nr:hypothetical protein [Jatrophihabitans sp.]